MLPLLVELIRHNFKGLDSKTIAELPEDSTYRLKLENSHYIDIPFIRAFVTYYWFFVSYSVIRF